MKVVSGSLTRRAHTLKRIHPCAHILLLIVHDAIKPFDFTLIVWGVVTDKNNGWGALA